MPKLITATDSIDVATLPLLLYGPPGAGKTSIAQTAADPFTLDFDAGIHRSFNRKDAMQFDTWAEVLSVGNAGFQAVKPHFDPFRSLVLDTGGRALDLMIPDVLAESAKNGYQGNLSPQGWGVLGARFVTWLKIVRGWRKQVVMVCHEQEKENAAGTPYFQPDLPGKMAWKEIHKAFDQIGRIRYEGRKRLLDFTPSENGIAKDAGGLGCVEIPDLAHAPTFLADLIVKAKANLSARSQESADIAEIVSAWETWIGTDPTLADLNGRLPELTGMPHAAKAQCWALLVRFAESARATFNKQTKTFEMGGAA